MKRIMFALLCLACGPLLAAPTVVQYKAALNYSPPGTSYHWNEMFPSGGGFFYWAGGYTDDGEFQVAIKKIEDEKMYISAFALVCGPDGEPPSDVRIIGTVTMKVATLKVMNVNVNPPGSNMNLVPGSIVFEAMARACLVAARR